MLTHTFTRTYNSSTFSDPYKQCLRCGGWIDGALIGDDGQPIPGPLTVVPCEHQDGYRDVCPSWGPVDGCTCAVKNDTAKVCCEIPCPDFVEARLDVAHDMRAPCEGDGHRY